MSNVDADGVMHGLLHLETTSTVQADVEPNQEPPCSPPDLENLELKGSVQSSWIMRSIEGHGDPSGLSYMAVELFCKECQGSVYGAPSRKASGKAHLVNGVGWAYYETTSLSDRPKKEGQIWPWMWEFFLNSDNNPKLSHKLLRISKHFSNED